jgi:hypothetical protein
VAEVYRAGTGRLFRGLDAGGRPVKLQVLEIPVDDSGDDFFAHARDSASVSHASLAGLIEYGRMNGGRYLLTSWIDCEPLTRRLGGGLRADQVARLPGPVAPGHTHELPHARGDLHPRVRPGPARAGAGGAALEADPVPRRTQTLLTQSMGLLQEHTVVLVGIRS